MKNESVAREMPRYRCHKEVWALKIQEVQSDPGGAMIVPEEAGYGAFHVSLEYVAKHGPKAGGYFVAYPDGYQSWSPAEAFETGYTRISG